MRCLFREDTRNRKRCDGSTMNAFNAGLCTLAGFVGGEISAAIQNAAIKLFSGQALSLR